MKDSSALGPPPSAAEGWGGRDANRRPPGPPPQHPQAEAPLAPSFLSASEAWSPSVQAIRSEAPTAVQDGPWLPLAGTRTLAGAVAPAPRAPVALAAVTASRAIPISPAAAQAGQAAAAGPLPLAWAAPSVPAAAPPAPVPWPDIPAPAAHVPAGVRSVQALAEPSSTAADFAEPAPSVQLVATPAPASGSGAPAPGAAPAGQSEKELDGLAIKLYERLRSQIRFELLIDRERAGLLTDRG